MASAEDLELQFGDSVDIATFEQILEMDDDDEGREFSSGIVFGFLDQASNTFTQMDEALENKDLETLSALGHFLKGSSATLGYNGIRDECEKIQHYGKSMDETGQNPIDKEVALQRTSESIIVAKEAFDHVKILMERFFDTTSAAQED